MKKATLLFAAVLLSLTMLTVSASAQKLPDTKPEFSENEIGNLLMAISSDNPGLKKSGIYLAGKYKIDETVNLLLEEIKNGKNDSLKCLVALSLYRIGDETGIETIAQIARYGKSQDLKKLCRAIYQVYNAENGFLTANNK